MAKRIPLTDAVLLSVSKLVDDARTETREPSHSQLGFTIDRAKLSAADPTKRGETLGKSKRVRAILSWAIDNDLPSGEVLAGQIVSLVQASGGFRDGSPNFVGGDAIESLRIALLHEGFTLASDGEIRAACLDTLSGRQLTQALNSYCRRAKKGVEDAALLIGTGKDLMEATAAHVLTERYGCYSPQANFPTLLGQAFTELGMATPADPPSAGSLPIQRLERALYEAACAVNTLRNKQGTGHGRPWLPNVTDDDAKTAIEVIGCVAERMLAKL